MKADASIAWTRLPAAALTADVATAWDGLNAQRRDLPFLTAQAVSCALRVFGDGSQQLLVGRRGAEIVAMLVVMPAGRLHWRTFQPAQVPLGACVAAAGLALASLAASLLRGPLRSALAVSLTQIDPWLAPREGDAAGSVCTDYVPTAWIDLDDGDFEAYWSRRGKNLRQNMRKQRARLADDGVILQMRTWTAAADMAGAVERYGALESAGWKGADGTAINAGNVQGRFYRELLGQAAHDGGAVVYECLFSEKTVAMNLCLRRGATLVVLKTCYDESQQALSPAFLLHQDMLRALFEQGTIRRVEYYGRVMDWHTRWTDSQRMLYHLTSYRWPVVKRLADWRSRRAEVGQHAPPPQTLSPVDG